jgi:hypothetical protein
MSALPAKPTLRHRCFRSNPDWDKKSSSLGCPGPRLPRRPVAAQRVFWSRGFRWSDGGSKVRIEGDETGMVSGPIRWQEMTK